MDINSTHPLISLSKEVKEIATPLEKLGITIFSYIARHKNGNKINLSSDPKWIEDYYNLKLYNSSVFDPDVFEAIDGLFLWSADTLDSEITKHGRDYFNSDYGVTLVKSSPTKIEFFFFSGSINNPQMHNQLLSNMNLLEHFIVYFKSILSTKIDNYLASKKLRNLSTNKNANNSFTRSFQLSDGTISDFLNDTKVSKLVIDVRDKPVVFTQRETDCIKHLLQLKTAKEIAKTLNVSPRTVESYIDQIKDKLLCVSKSEVINMLFEFRDLIN